jgi:hypothetical protein
VSRWTTRQFQGSDMNTVESHVWQPLQCRLPSAWSGWQGPEGNCELQRPDADLVSNELSSRPQFRGWRPPTLCNGGMLRRLLVHCYWHSGSSQAVSNCVMADANYKPACTSWGRNSNNPMSWRPLFPWRSSHRSSCCPASESGRPQTMDSSIKELPLGFESRTGLPSSAADLSSGDSLRCDGFSGTQCSHVQAWEPARGKRHCYALDGFGSEIENGYDQSSLTLARFLRISFFTAFTFINRTCEAVSQANSDGGWKIKT